MATGLGNIDEILPFITQVFKHEGGFPSPNQICQFCQQRRRFSLRVCEIKGVVLTISQEELSFESALWLAQSYLESGGWTSRWSEAVMYLRRALKIIANG